MQFIIEMIEKYGLFAVFLNLFVEGLGLPLPAYPILMIAAALAPQLHYSLAAIIATGMTAILLTDSLWFWGGRIYGASIVKILCRISLAPDSCVQNTNMMFKKVGPSSLSFAKFIPGFSTIGIVLASAMRLPIVPIIFFDVLGVLIYISLGVALGAIFHNAIADTLAVLSNLGERGLMLVVGAFAMFIGIKWVQRKRFLRQMRMNRITVDELNDMISLGQQPVILDVRPHELRYAEGMIPGSIIAHDANLKAIASRFPNESEVVVYCSCPDEASAVMIAQKLKKAGFKKIRPLLGGISAWAEAGHAVEAESEDNTSIAA